MEKQGSFKSLIPLMVFIFSFLGIGIILDDFYALPAPIAVILGIMVAFALFSDSLEQKTKQLVEGCGDSKVMTMGIIYLLAGAFATVSKQMGAVDAVVNFGLDFISIQFLPVGVFLIASFLSIATGTSVGSIVALGPIVVGLADKSGTSLALMSATLLGGAMFGDNLSIISDTTIAATQSLGVKMKDKFRANVYIALPAAIVTVVILLVFGLTKDLTGIEALPEIGSYDLIKIIPYLLVIILAVMGVPVFHVLIIGIVVSGFMGMSYDSFSLMGFAKTTYSGFEGMTEVFLLAIFSGGLAAMTAHDGGINFTLRKVKEWVKGKKSAQFGLGALIGITNLAIANNTVTLLITGDISKEISETYEVDKRKAAALIDIFSCIVQGLLPYGAQVLILLKFTDGRINFFDLAGHVWYLYLLLIFAILAILVKPWDKKISAMAE
ncbi:MAG: Na+/H+ antiporter NhaC family protein [Reichenbachiella sp.]|uniref:Na+/H+ antiporter NhaC family protein n=1 Tax=Reichenbachiella sp. TaxID=2184521 RepID=UPI0032647F99